MVIGTQKAGTTYLCKALSKHPDIFLPPSKELFFFSKRGITKHDYLNYLKNYFQYKEGKRWVGEGSTTYFQWPYALTNIAHFIGQDIKFILCLRHPTEKAISFYIHNWRRGRYKSGASILSAGQGDARLSPTYTSKYAEPLRRWLKVYSRDQLKIVFFDFLQKDPYGFVKQVTDYLDIPAISEVQKDVVNPGLPLVWDNNYLIISNSGKDNSSFLPRFPKEEIQILHERFLQDIDETSELLEIDLSKWKEFPQFPTSN